MKLFTMVLAFTIIGHSTAVVELGAKVDEAAHHYDASQNEYESCAQEHPLLKKVKEWHIVMPDAKLSEQLQQDDLSERLQEYTDAQTFLDSAIAVCKDDPSKAVGHFCWGFWPKDTNGDIHWKMMPCDE